MSDAPVVFSGPADVMASLPHLLGYVPSRSLVVVCVNDGALGMVARVDLPTDDELGELVSVLVPRVARQVPSVVLLLGYESAPGESEPAVGRALVGMIAAGLIVAEPVIVSESGWRHLTGACCPHELPDAANAAALALRVSGGWEPFASRAALVARVAASERSQVVGGLCDRVADRGYATVPRAALAWGRVLSPAIPVPDLPDHVLAVAAVGLAGDGVELRDVLMAMLCPGTVPLESMDQRTVTALRGSLPPGWSATRRSPNTEDSRAMIARLMDVCASLPDRHAVPVLTVLGMVSWWLGDGSVARIATDRATAEDPDYRLAGLIARMLDEAIGPNVLRSPTE